MLVYAHRGSSAVAPENTLLAFARAVSDGADGVTLDVRLTADGVPVVIRDRELARTTDGWGDVDQLPLDRIAALDAGQGERVPTLTAALDLLAGQVLLAVEVKQEGAERPVLAALARYPQANWALASSDHGTLRSARGAAPNAELWLVAVQPSDEAFALCAEVEATTLSLPGQAVTPEVARRCFAADLDLAVWTVNRVEDARLARLHGCSVLCTDSPAQIIAGLAAG